MKNRLYPTYQLHAVMAARKTTPEDGLKIGVLTILDWLRHRLGPDAPETLTAPQPERYADFSWENLRSLYINQGYVIDIVSLPEQGAWTMQIVEPDLGSDPGNPEQRRQAVPGRVIESNIAFRQVRQLNRERTDADAQVGRNVVRRDLPFLERLREQDERHMACRVFLQRCKLTQLHIRAEFLHWRTRKYA